MSTRTISGVLRKPVTNALWGGAVVTFRLTRPFAIAGASYPTQALEVTSDPTTAEITVVLAVPDSGSARYECILPDKRNFVFFLEAGAAAVNFEDLVAGAYAAGDAGEGLQVLIDNHAATGHLTADQEAAIDGANAPSALNVFATIGDVGGGGGINNLVEDLSPQLGGNLDLNGFTITDLDALPKNAAILSKVGAYELAAGDEAKIIECNGTFSLTCPNGLATGFQVVIVNVGSGTITIAATTTLQSKDSATQLTAQYASAVVYHRGSNVWLLFGDIE